MNTLSFSIITFGLCVSISFSDAQVITSPTSVPIAGAVCPYTPIVYTVSIPDGFSSCSRLWTITNGNGTFSSSGNTGISVTVTWDESSNNHAEIKVTFSNCGNGNSANGAEATKSSIILTIALQDFNPLSYNPTVNVPFCLTSQVNLVVGTMFVPNFPSVQANFYQWTIPSGWKQYNTTDIGPVWSIQQVHLFHWSRHQIVL